MMMSPQANGFIYYNVPIKLKSIRTYIYLAHLGLELMEFISSLILVEILKWNKCIPLRQRGLLIYILNI